MTKTPVYSKAKRPGKAAAFNSKVSNRQVKGSFSVGLEAKRGAEKHQAYTDQLEEEIALLTSYGSDTVYRLNYDTMKYDYISPTVVYLLGYSPEEMKKIDFRSLIVETRIIADGIEVVDSFTKLEQVRKNGGVVKWQADYEVRTKEGSTIWVSDISYPWFDDNGQVIGSVGSMRDITARMMAEARSRQQVDKLANVDALTGLANRREFFTQLDREIKRNARSEEDVAMLLVDVDNFRDLSKRYGDDVSDVVLMEVTKIISSCLRETDMAARLSGEEFGVLLPETTMQGAFWVAERIRLAVLQCQMLVGTDQTPVGCSVSVGIASSNAMDDKASSDMFKEADTRLYIAKNTGRNQVSVDEIMHTH